MKKYITLFLLFLSTQSFAQQAEFKRAMELNKQKKHAEAIVLFEQLLNKQYGPLDENTQIYCMALTAGNYYALNNYKKAYEKYDEELKFLRTIKKEDDKNIKALVKFMEELKSIIPDFNTPSAVAQNTAEANSAAQTAPTDKTVTLTVSGQGETKDEAKQDDKVVTIVVSGKGKTQDEAKQNAFRSAIEQAFGTFISSKTEILNDSLVKDEIISVANGNIQKFDIISENETINKSYEITLRVTLSLNKLMSFVESKGGTVSLNGGAFSFNVKKEDFYSKTEASAINNFLNSRFDSQIYFDFTLLTKPPKVNGENYSIELEVGIKANENLFAFFSDFVNLLKNVSLDEATVAFRKQSNLPLYKIEILGVGTYYLRSSFSFSEINGLDKYLYYKTCDFKIVSKPEFELPNSYELIKSNVFANNFIIKNIEKSPNAGVYWKWLPYVFSDESEKSNESDRAFENYLKTTDKINNRLELRFDFLKNIPKQSEINKYSEHMGSVINNNRVDYNLVLGLDLKFSKSDFETLDSFTVIPELHKY